MKWTLLGFPFYTLGRFQNTPCTGSNNLLGTCVLAGECKTSGGVSTGACNSITRQAVCCVCKFSHTNLFPLFSRKMIKDWSFFFFKINNLAEVQLPTIIRIL